MLRGLIGLHGKFVISLLIAAALPFFVGLIAVETLAYRLMVEERGGVHQLEASSLLASVAQASNAEGEKMRSWLAAENQLVEFVAGKSRAAQKLDPMSLEQEMHSLDDIWESIPLADPKIREVLTNPTSRSIISYKAMHEQVAEVIVTDSLGRLVAATSKPSDYYQGDEYWWAMASGLPEGSYWRDTIHYDESSKVFVIDISMPLHKRGEMVGVLKVSVEVAKLVPHLMMSDMDSRTSWAFVLRDGYILTGSDDDMLPLEDRLPEATLTEMKLQENGWCVGIGHDGRESIIGFSAFGSDYLEPNAYVMFSTPSEDLFDPLWMSFIGTAVAGIMLLGLCFLVGFFIIQRRVLNPLSSIEAAVRSLSVLMRLHREETLDKQEVLAQQQKVEANLRATQKIRTGDQMELLAREIATMISRVMRYQYEVENADNERSRAPGSGGGDKTAALARGRIATTSAKADGETAGEG